MTKIFRLVPFVMLSFLLMAEMAPAATEAETAHILGRIPVQHAGRIKPFKSYAREAALMVLGRHQFEGVDSTLLLWQWMAEPDEWSSKSLLLVRHPDVKKIFEADLEGARVAPSLVTSNLHFLKEVQTIQVKQEQKEDLSDLEKKKLDLYHRARLFGDMSRGRQPGFVPHPDRVETAWLPIDGILHSQGAEFLKTVYPDQAVERVQNSLSYLLGRLEGDTVPLVATSASFFESSLKELLESRDILLEQTPIQLELLYLAIKPFHLAWILYLASVLLLVIVKQPLKIALPIYSAGFILHTIGFFLRCLISSRPPVTNMYESVIWVSWATVLFSLVLFWFHRNQVMLSIAGCVATLALLIGENLPTVLDQSIAPLVPVLRSNYWLTIHVLTITLGYGAFMLNWGIAHALLYQLAFHRRKTSIIEPLTEFLYRSLQIGIVLLAAGTILGGVWAADSWGRFWGWDPKETWALIAILAYLAVLHGRTAGWLDTFATAFWCALCFLTVVMAWYGVNFVLAAGLHSYGFGGGGLQYVAVVVAVDLGILYWFVRRYKKK